MTKREKTMKALADWQSAVREQTRRCAYYQGLVDALFYVTDNESYCALEAKANEAQADYYLSEKKAQEAQKAYEEAERAYLLDDDKEEN